MFKPFIEGAVLGWVVYYGAVAAGLVSTFSITAGLVVAVLTVLMGYAK